MKKTEDLFTAAKNLQNKIQLKKDADLLLLIFTVKLLVKKWLWDITMMVKLQQ